MGTVGIIVNPVSGTDIRRVTSTAGFMDNMQKARIVKSILKGLEAAGVDKVVLMPDFYGVAAHALWDTPSLGVETEFVDMEPEGSHLDTVRAVEAMTSMGVGVIVLLGGDGTVRIASKASGETPLLPISTGTNNVVPYFIDGTVAGLAAGMVANGLIEASKATYRLNRVKLILNGELVDHALVDVASTRYPFVGSRAIMDPGLVRDVVVALAPPTSIGLASIAAMIRPLYPGERAALHLRLGAEGFRVRAIVAPGVVEEVGVEGFRELRLGEEVVLGDAMTVELDGERELQVSEGDEVVAIPSGDGPYILDVHRVMGLASAEGLLRRTSV